MGLNVGDDFLQYCYKNNLKKVKLYLRCGINLINRVSGDGLYTGLSFAARYNRPDLVDILLSHPDIKVNNTTDPRNSNWSRQWTALMFACQLGNSAIVSRLVQVPGLDINYQDVDGDTAAHLASQWGHTECVRILAKTGRVDWNCSLNWGGHTALYQALCGGHSAIVDIIVQLPNIDCNVKTYLGYTLGHAAVLGNVKCVETLVSGETFDSWNVPDRNGDTPIMLALKRNKTNVFEILLRCPRVELTCRDQTGWSLLFRAIQSNKLDLVKMILSKLEKPYSGSSLARIAVEVGEEEDIRVLIQSGSTVDWNETVEDEDPAILWALKSDKFRIVDILMAVNKTNLQGHPSADLTINCDSETFRVHKYFLCSRSTVFSAMLNCNLREAREGEINIRSMNSDTLSSMIHYIYTGELADGWEELDILDMTRAADMYDLLDWIEIFSSELRTVEVSAVKVADMIIAASRYKHSAAWCRLVARDKIRARRREITDDPAFIEKLRGEDPIVVIEFLAVM